MGSFSWLKADNLTNVANIPYGYKYKFLIPKEFGGGYIIDNYHDYGILLDGTKTYDIYELIAFWNKDILEENGFELKYDGKFPMMKEMDKHTEHNRCVGIDIGCYDEQVDKLKYPLKLVSIEYKGDYESLDRPSYYDPNQGFYPVYRKK